ncbi:MAG: tetratricopeptide repeat protein [Bryobacteraceae bacterium]|nr:tetratricopeptide repeat protein [Bryobacteraceae bacterium]
MDRKTRKELKTDHFVEEVEHGVEYVAGHRSQIVRIGAIVAAVLAVAGGVYGYTRSQRSARMDLLNQAYMVQSSPFGPAQDGVKPKYATQAERDKAAQKAFAEVVAKYGSSDEGQTAHYFLGTYAANEARWSDAEKSLTAAMAGGNPNVTSLAKLVLAQVYGAQNKIADAEKLLRELSANPTDFVSKEQAELALGRLLMPAKPAEAKKLLEPLRGGKGAIGRAALGALGENQ